MMAENYGIFVFRDINIKKFTTVVNKSKWFIFTGEECIHRFILITSFKQFINSFAKKLKRSFHVFKFLFSNSVFFLAVSGI